MLNAIEVLQDKVEKMEAENKSDGGGRAETVTVGLPRSCNEIKEINPNLTFGEYIIDPDGMHLGYDPITVLCDDTGNILKFCHAKSWQCKLKLFQLISLQGQL